MKDRLRGDLRTAMKARRAQEAALLRALIAVIDNAEAPPLAAADDRYRAHDFRSGSAEVERLLLDDARIRELLQAEVNERERVAADLERLGQGERAGALRTEALLTRRYID
ncbi:hypothetical protein [Uliginosibacterium sp. H1]|uniref:hypothetical protein n=1 Tax=Uliginosibacterium sp. H1 TaxID=3114757 RepID=UPI002E1980FC|nr:hypothetical protein [Uliginosibacterium sp. H1]